MERIKLFRKENGEALAIASGVVYIKDSGVWRETTKLEMDLVEAQTPIHPDVISLTYGVQFVTPEYGKDGDYYVLLYPFGWEGDVWSGIG